MAYLRADKGDALKRFERTKKKKCKPILEKFSVSENRSVKKVSVLFWLL